MKEKKRYEGVNVNEILHFRLVFLLLLTFMLPAVPFFLCVIR